jgi:hypothetical protein
MKAIRMNILGAWQTYSPAQIVRIFRKAYRNVRTLSVMISRFKKQLSQLESPPPDTFLKAIKLKKEEYKDIHEHAINVRLLLSGIYGRRRDGNCSDRFYRTSSGLLLEKAQDYD